MRKKRKNSMRRVNMTLVSMRSLYSQQIRYDYLPWFLGFWVTLTEKRFKRIYLLLHLRQKKNVWSHGGCVWVGVSFKRDFISLYASVYLSVVNRNTIPDAWVEWAPCLIIDRGRAGGYWLHFLLGFLQQFFVLRVKNLNKGPNSCSPQNKSSR